MTVVSAGRLLKRISVRHPVMKHGRRLVRFGLVGASGVLVNYALLYLLAEAAGLNHLVAAALATEGAILSNFVLNNRWTFRDRRTGVTWVRRALRYNFFVLGGLAISVGVLAALTELAGLHYMFANLFAIGAGTLWNYAASYRWTWTPAPKERQNLHTEAEHVC